MTSVATQNLKKNAGRPGYVDRPGLPSRDVDGLLSVLIKGRQAPHHAGDHAIMTELSPCRRRMRAREHVSVRRCPPPEHGDRDLHRAVPVIASSARPGEASGGGQACVLLVEDDVTISDLVAYNLRRAGYRVIAGVQRPGGSRYRARPERRSRPDGPDASRARWSQRKPRDRSGEAPGAGHHRLRPHRKGEAPGGLRGWARTTT